MTDTSIITIECIEDPDIGGFTALIPGLPVFGEGETEQKAIEDLKTGIQLYIDQYGIEMLQEKIIAPSSLKTLPFAELVHG